MGNTFAEGRAAWHGVEAELEVGGETRIHGPGGWKSKSLWDCFKTACWSLKPKQ